MSLLGEYQDDNIFAKILRGEIPSYKVYEDDVVLAFMDAFPVSDGHTLVIPKTPVRNFLELPPSAVGPYMECVQKVALAVRKATNPAGLRVMQFNGAPSGQTVFHLHFHIMPVYEGQPVALHGGKQGDPAKLKDTAAKISAALS